MHMSVRPAARMRCAAHACSTYVQRAHMHARMCALKPYMVTRIACTHAHTHARTGMRCVPPVQGHVRAGVDEQQRTVSCGVAHRDLEQTATTCMDTIIIYFRAQQHCALGHAVSPTPTCRAGRRFFEQAQAKILRGCAGAIMGTKALVRWHVTGQSRHARDTGHPAGCRRPAVAPCDAVGTGFRAGKWPKNY